MRIGTAVAGGMTALAVAGWIGSAHVLTPADEFHRIEGLASIQLLSFERGRHGGQPYASWALSVINTSDSTLHLSPRTTCRVGLFLPRTTGHVPAVDEADGAELSLPAGLATSLRGTCVMPEGEDRFFYSVQLSDDADSPLGSTFVFHGEMQV
ncbi:hypothetical protein [Streptomonospora litoralis]|uniref:DUF4352 domain-containing protein n=1 Tax=Streptomonospora litoralis TaxID=2498135 RepID=A0A4P6Q0I6_9ACTN|nr:hypothetical protein [Streptomonospora litoralis]QBI53580.1 hypothetical protein EKD16_08930 [Streptomonospora litoralis]